MSSEALWHAKAAVRSMPLIIPGDIVVVHLSAMMNTEYIGPINSSKAFLLQKELHCDSNISELSKVAKTKQSALVVYSDSRKFDRTVFGCLFVNVH